MNVAEVKLKLGEMGVPESAYAFQYRRSDEQFLLYKESEQVWVVSFMERGSEASREEFPDEHLACVRFLEKIARDRSVPKRPPPTGGGG